MTRHSLLAAFLVFGGTSASAQVATELTPAAVQQAIADQKADGCYPLKEAMSKWSWGGSHWGCFTTPYSRVVMAAQAARKRYKPFTTSDVTPELVAPGELHVYGWARKVEGSPRIDSVEAIVILPKKSKDPAQAIQPSNAEPITEEYKNLMGATLEGRSLKAVFPLTVLKEGYEVHFVYEGLGDKTAAWKLDKIK